MVFNILNNFIQSFYFHSKISFHSKNLISFNRFSVRICRQDNLMITANKWKRRAVPLSHRLKKIFQAKSVKIQKKFLSILEDCYDRLSDSIIIWAGNYMFKWRHWRRSGVFIVSFEHISDLVLVFLLLILNWKMPAGRGLVIGNCK